MPQHPKEDEKRDRFRVPVNMKALVKCGDKTEIGTIENLSRKGAFITVTGDYERGSYLYLLFPYEEGQPTIERYQFAEVARVIPQPFSDQKGVGVKLLDVRIKHSGAEPT